VLVSTKRKPVCDFLLVNNINLHPTPRTVCQLSRSICQIISSDKRVSLVNAFVLGNLCVYHHMPLASCLIYAREFVEYVYGCVLFQDVTVREIRGR